LGNTSGDPLKQRLERTVTREFLLFYNLVKGRRFRILRPGVPPEPDVLCKDANTGQEIGIEITTAYNEADYAKAAWGQARGRSTKPYFFTRPDRKENIRILTQVHRIIKKKGRKQRADYAVPGQLLLVVFTYSPRFYLLHMKRRLDSLRIPKSHPYDEIYLMDQAGLVYCLFPARRWVLP
jgi:hypothetical protein